MKRLSCFLLFLILLIPCASAETNDLIFDLYNAFAEEFTELEADVLPEDFNLSVRDDGTASRLYSISDKLKVMFISDSDDVYYILVWDISASVDDEFLSACKIATMTMMLDYNSGALNIVDQKYRLVLEGKESDPSLVDGYYIHLEKGTGYFFSIMSQEGFREHNK